MSPALNGSSAIRHFEGSDAIEIRDGITFDFYTGLPHLFVTRLPDVAMVSYLFCCQVTAVDDDADENRLLRLHHHQC